MIFCGGYTTFSTFSAENLRLLKTGNFILSRYIVVNVLLGIIAVGIVETKVQE
ncbi:CrcB family protein [Proteiniphilum sp.]|uniref:fluoride efflux transporter FluC n=1 Tax=Proteiniphilum sp. TaxID=1926877 RepID=UPI002B2142D3|nr:CrcB family protein [Proteiniphilum sp.]MEA4916372.1 CrcB family protein [Proteiniphilum sp.]